MTFRTPVEKRYFEDYEEGSVHEFGSIAVEEEEIISFGRRYDPQVFHTDPVEATKTVFGGLVASGWHTAALAMRMIVDHYLSHVASLGSPGVDELRWLKPVRPGNRLSLRISIVETRRSRTKPDRGIVRLPCGGVEPGSRGSYELEGDEHASMPECLNRSPVIIWYFLKSAT